jgi:hypothetical protein
MRRLAGFLICGLVGVALLGLPTLAQADRWKCGAALEKEVQKLTKDMLLRLGKCTDRIDKEKLKKAKGSIPNGAAFCEKMIRKTVDVGRQDGGKSKLDKFFAGVLKAGTTGKCDNSGTGGQQDLDDLGHFVGSGGSPAQNAPGSEFEFVQNWLGANALFEGIKTQILANEQTRTRIEDAIDEAGDTKAPGTDCTDGASGLPNVEYRPNLCAFAKDPATPQNLYTSIAGTLNPICRTHACKLVTGDGDGGTTNDSEALIALEAPTIVAPIRGINMYEICDMGNLPAPFTLQDHFLITGGPAHNILDADLGSVGIVCVYNYRSIGWCDCAPGGTGLGAKDQFLCVDHVVDPNSTSPDDCGGRPDNAVEEECICAPITSQDCRGLTACDQIEPYTKCSTDADCAGTDICITDKGGSRCHAGNFVGEQVVQLGTAMTEGDCLVFTQTTLTTVAPGEEGPDGIACTDDDEPSQGDESRIPLTTGQASAQCRDCIINTTISQCINNPKRVGPCLEDRDCWADATNSTGAFCDKTGSARGIISAAPQIGTKANCVDYESSDLGTLALAGALPLADGSGLGDLAFGFRFICE